MSYRLSCYHREIVKDEDLMTTRPVSARSLFTVHATGIVLVATAALLWSTVGVTVRGITAVAATNALVIGFLRLAVAGPTLVAAHIASSHCSPFHIARRDWPAVLLLGAAMAAYQVTEFAALPRLGITRTILLAICTAPVFIALFAAIALHERLPRRAVLPMLLALCGTALLVGSGNTEAGGLPPVGVALALAAAAMYALVATASRALAPRYPAAQTVAVAFTVGAVLLAPFALTSGIRAFALGTRGWVLIVVLGLVPTAFAYLLFLRGLRTVPATTAGMLSLLEPLGATFLAAALFGERLPLLALAGAIILLLGLALFVMTSGAREHRE